MLLATELDIGGAEKNLYEIARKLSRETFLVQVACLFGRGPIGEWLKREDISVHFLNMKGKCDLSVIGKLRRLLLCERIDVLYTFLFHANMVGRVSAYLAGTPVVLSSIRVAEKRRPSHLIFHRFTQNLVTMEVAVSEDVRRFMIEKAKLRPKKVITIPNGVDISRFASLDREKGRAELGLRDEFTCLFVGRLDAQKGLRYLIGAWKQAFDRLAPAVLLIAGEGPQRKDLERITHEMDISSSVRFLGFREDVPLLLAASDLFVLPSLWEGLANACLEAMAASVPVVATQVEGMRELLLEGEGGRLVPPGDASSLTDAIVKMREDPDLSRQLASRAFANVRQNFTVEKMVESTERLLESLANELRVERRK